MGAQGTDDPDLSMCEAAWSRREREVPGGPRSCRKEPE